MAADAPSSDITINIEGSNNDIKVEVLELLKEEDTSGMTKEELQDLVNLLTKFVAAKHGEQGLAVNITTNPEKQVTDSSQMDERSENSKADSSETLTEEDEQGETSTAAKVISYITIGLAFLSMFVVFGLMLSLLREMGRY